MKWFKLPALLVVASAGAAYAADPGPAAPAEAAVKVAFKKAEDKATVTTEKGVTTINIICPSGIGAAVLTKAGKEWGSQIVIKFFTGEGKPFARLEGGMAKMVMGADKSEMVKNDDATKVTLKIDLPTDTSELTKVQVEWVDAYRN